MAQPPLPQQPLQTQQTPQQHPSLLLNLPDELINAVLTFLPPLDLVSCQLSCRTLHRLASESLVWRNMCIQSYRYWDKRHDFNTLQDAPPASVNFKQIFADRKRQDNAISEDLNSILGSQIKRVERAEDIVNLGYDAKDELVKHLDVSPDSQEYLSRRYWSSELLGTLERTQGIELWQRLADRESGKDIPIEQALGVFDLFIVERPPMTLDGISRHLDALADKFRRSEHYDKWETQSMSVKLRGLTYWVLNSENLTGMPRDAVFRDLKNTLISIALCEASHPSLPLISTVIFCCIAQRLGIDAHPCGYPMKVLAVIYPREGYPESSQGNDPIYVDPSTGQTEIELPRLRHQLSAWGIPAAHHPQYLEPASAISIVKRTARNIQESLSLSEEYDVVLDEIDPFVKSQNPSAAPWQTVLHPPRAGYCIAWCALLFRSSYDDLSARIGQADLRIPLTRLTTHIQVDFRQDIKMLQNYMKLQDARDNTNNAFLGALSKEIEDDDTTPPPVHRRSDLEPEVAKSIQYSVGQIFRHARYLYIGAITGWSAECEARDSWIRQMGVDSLKRGRTQPFYHVIVASDESSRYVADENIEIIRPDPESTGADMPDGFKRIAGRYFKRWDRYNNRFVSNVREQYPED